MIEVGTTVVGGGDGNYGPLMASLWMSNPKDAAMTVMASAFRHINSDTKTRMFFSILLGMLGTS